MSVPSVKAISYLRMSSQVFKIGTKEPSEVCKLNNKAMNLSFLKAYKAPSCYPTRDARLLNKPLAYWLPEL